MFRQSMRAVLVAVLAWDGLVAAGVAMAGPAVGQAGPAITLSPKVGPPTSTVTVSGAGFGAGEVVDIYFDTTDETLAVAGADGSFSGIDVAVPGSALPGKHYISAVSRATGQGAQDTFTVRTAWAQYRYSGKHTGANPTRTCCPRPPCRGSTWTGRSTPDSSSCRRRRRWAPAGGSTSAPRTIACTRWTR